ncbi:TetR/AcrR family transcriptional regulator [Nocardia cerradoensis]|uniref:Putative HTH-type transcriptional regulator YfiR n=1 Tax=Nocardia cerradoensis TaxID=85688 RepID=A0A231H7A2_9NOCA|nr:TetR/AcrR family transcriptional regulator [Nocardia cerradoensis]NKY47265.1 TetR/AcrR family transcriptional regulator [Nocardia cerradoensis]OXR44728.1 putative HTH-type transcriptional regulator YfiR [Nocardia cerradoensis]
MPRITAEHREANRAQIVAAARRCFSRDGFHQTSMPDIAAEAGVSVGAPYRYFTGKEEIIVEIAGDAFRVMFAPVEQLADAADVTVADLVAAAVDPVSGELAVDGAGQSVPVDELLRCAVQAWGELLRNEGLRRQATVGFEHVRERIADALRNGRRAGTVPTELDPDRGARVVMALLHGFVLQHAAFGLTDTAGFADDVRVVLNDAGLLRHHR